MLYSVTRMSCRAKHSTYVALEGSLIFLVFGMQAAYLNLGFSIFLSKWNFSIIPVARINEVWSGRLEQTTNPRFILLVCWCSLLCESMVVDVSPVYVYTQIQHYRHILFCLMSSKFMCVSNDRKVLGVLNVVLIF